MAADINNRHVRVIIKDEIECILSGILPADLDFFYDEFAVRAPGYFFNPRYKAKIWDGYERFFSKGGKTYVILLEKIIPILIRLRYKITVDDQRMPLDYAIEQVTSDYFSHLINPKNGKPWDIRPYQVDAINAITEKGNGVIIAGTAAGKTAINAVLIDLYGKQGAKTITIVPNVSLINQSMAFLKNFNLDIGQYGDLVHDTEHQHIITTWQSLKNEPHLIRDFDVLMVDECHGAKAKVLSKLLNEHGRKIAYRFGFTGSMPKEKAEIMKIEISLGPVRYTVPAHQLIEEGWLASLHITAMQLDDKATLEDGAFEFFDYSLESKWALQNKERMQWVADFLLEKKQQHGGNVLCLVTSVPYGKKLHKLIATEPNCYFLYGKDKNKVRQQVYDLFDKHDDLIVIATAQIAGVGLSIDRIFNLIYIDLGKSFTKIIQAIGRGLRKAADKDHVNVTDVCSNLKYGQRHLKQRQKYYKEAQYPFTKVVVEYGERNKELVLPE